MNELGLFRDDLTVHLIIDIYPLYGWVEMCMLFSLLSIIDCIDHWQTYDYFNDDRIIIVRGFKDVFVKVAVLVCTSHSRLLMPKFH